MKSYLVSSFLLILFVAGALLPGGCKVTETSEPEGTVAVQPAQPAEPPPQSGSGPWSAARIYPVDDVIRLEMQTPTEVPLNAAFDSSIRVTNLTDTAVSDVVVTERLPENFRLQKSDPPGEKDDGNLVWRLGLLAPKATREIKVSGLAATAEGLQPCATVTFVVPVCAHVAVVEPKLLITKTAPRDVLLCDPIPAQIVVTNSGSGAVQGVKIVDTLPPGMTTLDGRNELVLDAGTLAPGQSKQFVGTFKASRTGEFVNKAVASSSGGLKAEATTTTIVRQPVLAITKTGPARHYVGRPATYEITVTNKGDAPAANAIVEETLPQGVQAVKTSMGGTLSGAKVVWQLGALAVNASKKVSITYTPIVAGTLTNTATAAAVCANTVTATAKTTVYGIAAVLLEVIDTDDPVEIGGQTTYIIIATNQGSRASTDVQITCTLEDAQQYVSSGGATAAKVEGNVIRFAPLPILAARAKATWQVVVKAVKPGDVRFTTAMNTSELDRPVDETEATQQYE